VQYISSDGVKIKWGSAKKMMAVGKTDWGVRHAESDDVGRAEFSIDRRTKLGYKWKV
jgi:hypothetical protein